jgi:hypothetical protein
MIWRWGEERQRGTAGPQASRRSRAGRAQMISRPATIPLLSGRPITLVPRGASVLWAIVSGALEPAIDLRGELSIQRGICVASQSNLHDWVPAGPFESQPAREVTRNFWFTDRPVFALSRRA